MIITTETTGYGYRVSARGALRAEGARTWLNELRTHVDRVGVGGASYLLDARGLTWDSVGVEATIVAGLRCLAEGGIARSAVVADTPEALFELRRLGREAGLYESQRYFLADADRAAVAWVAEGVEEAWPRQSERRAELALFVDALGEALLLCDLQGRVLHANASLVRALGGDPEGTRLRQELEGLARASTQTRGGAAAEREVRTALQAYRLRRSAVGDALGGPAAALLVSLQPVGLQPRTDDELRTRFGLTEREIEVARHLADGRTNAEIARVLGISPFTARNHTERVLGKLGVSNRARVAGVLTAAA